MALTIGTQLGSHEITGLLGKGGMGEVYRARDLKLKRDVAIKILPEEFSPDSDRASRFQREAEVLASLNHSNIAAIYDLEEADGVRFLVLELVEGETLAERIGRGPVPFEEALDIARQICEALEAAHEKSIIHRDLKPANVKIAPDGKVKVLDFGLAKAMETAPANAALSNSPTMLSGTLGGMILGTAGYMSPEQAKGRPADKRSDVWAFGCVFYEMLTGRRAFEGEDVSDTLAAVLRAEPDWRMLPADLPTPIGTLVKRCLEKDRRQRAGDIAVVRFVLNEPSFGTKSVAAGDSLPEGTPPWRRMIAGLALLVFGAALASTTWWVFRPVVGRPQVTRYTIVPEGIRVNGVGRHVLAWSRDGAQLVYTAGQALYLRSMSDFQARVIPGTEGSFEAYPAFSPDGRSIAFYQSSGASAAINAIKRVPVTGGTPVTICDLNLSNGLLGLSWGPDGILFGEPEKGIMRVSPDGGKPELLVGMKSGEAAADPQMLPDGHTLLFSYSTGALLPDRWDKAQIVAQSLESGERKVIVQNGADVHYLPSGHLVYALEGVLFAVPFDVKQLTTGPAVSVVSGVLRGTGPFAGAHAVYSVSDSGSLAYLPGPALISSAKREVNVINRAGVSDTLKLPSGSYEAPRVSPDGTRIAVDSDDGKQANIWVYDVSQTRAPVQITFDGRNRLPVWSGDGKYVAYLSDREGGGIFRQLADGSGTAERLTIPDPGTTHIPNSWSRDGRTLLMDVVRDSRFSLSTWSATNKKIVSFDNVVSSRPTTAVFSPDGRWVAYTLRKQEQARDAVFVEPFPPTGSKYQISHDDDGHHPLWSSDGKLLYNTGTRLVELSVATQPGFSVVGVPEPVPGSELFNVGPGSPRSYDLMRDRSIVGVASIARQALGTNPRIDVVVNWFTELQQRVPVK
jgi:serine/threonine-protein kinase